MKQLMEERCKFNDISTPPLPAAQVSVPLGTKYHEFQSRKKIEEEIMEALRAKEVRMMGICGMGGVGKTTMAKKILNRAKEESIFEEILMVVVSQQVDMLKIQGAMAESLGLSLGEETLLARATKLRARLTGTKKILIVLDDVWENLKLEDLGIPCGNEVHQGCTVLSTSRNRDVLNKMDAQKICEMEILLETEAWSLFREKAGTCVNDLNLHSIAKKVVSECKCLPIALIAVGGALKEQTSITIWEDALQQLKNFNPEDMPDVIRDVYKPLKLSYTYLENRHAKSLFLLCGLFPEDDDISLEELTFYCVGLLVFRNLDNFSDTSDGTVEQVRKRVLTIVDKLKNRFLLLSGSDEHCVRMHDVVRDVAIYIASQEAKEGNVDVKFNSLRSSSEVTRAWVSVFSEDQTSSLFRMHTLRMRGSTLELEDYSLLEEMKGLNVLSFNFIAYNLQPREIEVLKNLRTLHLESCWLGSFFIVGELRSLEILYCHNCYGIEELPVELGKLKQLKLFHFSRSYLKRIPPGVVSNWVELEEFKMISSFWGWELAATAEVRGQERRNACLNEFEKLTKLTCLEIEIQDINLAAEEICFSPNIAKYMIIIGRHDTWPQTNHDKYIHLELPRHNNLGSWVRRFLSNADNIEFRGDGSNNQLDLPQAHNTKSLTFEGCSTVKEVVNSSSTSIHDDGSNYDVFPNLEYLGLFNLPNLEEVYDGTVLEQSNCLQNLERLYLNNLPALRHLWKQRPSRNIISLDKLNEICIEGCNNLHNLFSFTTSNGISQISTVRSVDDLLCTQKVQFPKLKYLSLRGLDKLEVIWNTPIKEGSNSFKNLTTLKLSNLPAITQIQKTTSANVSMNILTMLVKLKITNCKMMDQVWLNEENENDGNQCRTIKFPKLSKLKLDSLESLTAFGEGIEIIEFPMLEAMKIKDCPKLTSLLSSNENNQISRDVHEDDTSHLFCSQKVLFGSLKKIHVETDDRSNIWCDQISHGFFGQLEKLQFGNCNGIKSLFSSSIAENLVGLKELMIFNCDVMVKVIEDDEEKLREKPHSILFPSLVGLHLVALPKLESFCDWRCDLRLPSLCFLNVIQCPLLKQFSSIGSVATPQLGYFRMDHREDVGGDLTNIIQQHFNVLQEERRKKDGRIEELTSPHSKDVKVDHEKGEIEEQIDEAEAS